MIPDKFIRGNAEMTEEYRNFCAGAMISLGLFVALTCLALRGAALNMKNLLLILDKISDRMDAWLHTEPMLPTQATFKATDTNAVAILLIPQIAEIGKGMTTSIRLPRSISASNLRIRSPPMTPQFSDRTDLFLAQPATQQKPNQEV